jgi:hypothetical protein
MVVGRRRILLIEDEESIAEPLADALEREGFDVETVTTAAQGREEFRKRSPDLVLLDVSSGVDLTGSTTEIGTTTGADEAGDISGPCDEAEHANDPRCTGATVPGADDDNRDDDGPGDISGPCDEAEHANDPRCTSANPADSSGPGPGGQDEDNSGPGGGDEDDSGPADNSGPGSGGDDVDHDDNSGPGSGSGSGPSGSG